MIMYSEKIRARELHTLDKIDKILFLQMDMSWRV